MDFGQLLVLECHGGCGLDYSCHLVFGGGSVPMDGSCGGGISYNIP